MNILITKNEVKEAKKLGFEAVELTPSVYAVEVDPPLSMTYLRQLNAEEKSHKEYEKNAKLRAKRKSIADNEFETYRFDKEGANVVDSEGWENDGPDRLIRKIYWEPTGETVDQSTVGSFIVDFKTGTLIVEEAYANL